MEEDRQNATERADDDDGDQQEPAGQRARPFHDAADASCRLKLRWGGNVLHCFACPGIRGYQSIAVVLVTLPNVASSLPNPHDRRPGRTSVALQKRGRYGLNDLDRA